jgi:hypothetical protein
MFLIQLEDGQPVGYAVTYDNFKQANPNVSLPFPVLPEYVEPFGFGMFEWTNQPAHDTFELVEETAPQKGAGDIWYQSWIVRPMTDEERTERVNQEWQLVRFDRNRRLAACDWTQLPDAPLSNTETADWGSYRQALRDITTQGDPFNIQWPAQPT